MGNNIFVDCYNNFVDLNYLGIRGVWLPDLFLNLGTEIIGIIITVLIVDKLYKRRDLKNLKNQLLRQLRSSDPAETISTIRELDANGWGDNLDGIVLHGGNFTDANLQGKSLKRVLATSVIFQNTLFNGADLSEATLRNADLRGANFAGAILDNAELDGANLEGAYFNDVEKTLSKVSMLYGAILPNGKIYDGRFNLLGDEYRHFSTGGEDSPKSWAKFYNISKKEYLLGQKKS